MFIPSNRPIPSDWPGDLYFNGATSRTYRIYNLPDNSLGYAIMARNIINALEQA